MLQKFTIQRRGEEHENQKRLLRKEKKKQLMDPAQPCKNQPLSLFHTEDSPATSALAFGHSGSQGWGSKLDCCLLEDRSSPNAAQLTAGGAKLHSSAAGGKKERKKKQQSFKAFQANCYGNKNTADFSWTSPRRWGKSWQQRQRQFDGAVFGPPLCPLSLVNEIILQQPSAACYS